MEEHQAKVKRQVNVSAMDEPSSQPKLPLEIIEEILSRLPAVSLSNYRSVCKSWNGLIADPRFVKKHLGRSKGLNHLRIFINQNSEELILRSYSVDSILSERTGLAGESVRFPLSREIRTFGFVGSCNGLVCFMVGYGTLVEIYICNFSTRESRKFPSKFSTLANRNIFGFGFGYDSNTDDYKLLRMDYVFAGRGKTITIDIFSLATCSPKRIQDFPYEGRINEDGSPNSVFLNGSFHWTARHGQSMSIVALDLATETYKEIPQPELLDESNPSSLTKLDALEDRLLLLCNYRRRYHDVWMMKAYGVKESWTKLVRVPCSEVTTPIVVLPKLISISDDGESILMIRQLSLVMYSTKEKVFYTLPSPNFSDLDDNGYRLRARLGFTTVASLVSPTLIMRRMKELGLGSEILTYFI